MEIQTINMLVERALADGILTKAESDIIKNAVYSDKKVTHEEARLLRLLNEKVWKGEILLDNRA
jgi:hypothetical protein